MADLQSRQKEDTRKSREVLEELKQLRIKMLTLERERSIYSNKIVSHLLVALSTEEIKLEKKRAAEKLELKQKINKIKHKIFQLQRTLKDTTQTNPSSVERIKETLEDIENAIRTFKDKQREIYELLLQQERLACQEVMAHKRLIDSWTTSSGGGAKPDMIVTSHVTLREEKEEEERGTRNDPPIAVSEFQSFLYHKGGHTGGWEELDQNVFVKLWTKHKGVEETFIDEAIREIPSHTPESIQEHVVWYKEYCSLRDASKLAINEWRQQKEAERKKVVSDGENEKKKKEEEEKRIVIKEKLKEKEREEKKKKLEEWRQEQLAIQLRESEQEKLRKQNELLKEKRKQERQAVIKRQAQEYGKMKKEEKKKKELMEMTKIEEQKERRKTANKCIQQFQQRDRRTLQVKQELLASQQTEQEHKRAQLDKIKESVSVKVKRDPSRLLQPTSVWIERQKAHDNGQPSVPLVSIPKRATPTWRQNI